MGNQGTTYLNTSLVMVKRSGNVGIGTVSPSSLLHVNGAINCTSLLVNGTAVATGTGSVWGVSGSTAYYTSGNVGIGTTDTQNNKLRVFGGNAISGISLGDYTTTAGVKYIGMTAVSDGTSIGASSGFSGITFGPALDGGTSGYLAFHTHGYGVSSGERVRIDKAGLVGIGTTAPATLLHVYSTTAANTFLIEATSSSSYASMYFKNNTPASAYMGIGGSAVGGNFQSNFFIQSPNSIVLNTNGNNSTGTVGMIINTSGYVGIGTATPVGQLSVVLNGTAVGNTGTWGAGHVVFGPGAGSTTGDGVGITYNTAATAGAIICLTPGAYWRLMAYYALQHDFYIGATRSGYVNSSGFVNVSDEREKINIKEINTSRSLERILACVPKTFQRVMDRNDPTIPDEVKNKWNIGLIAQEVMSINPHCISESVNQNGEMRYGFNYTDFVPHLIGSVKELSKIIAEQDARIKALEAKLASQ
jgi:hypothetical protein